jgi:hypothetical protein
MEPLCGLFAYRAGRVFYFQKMELTTLMLVFCH